MKKRFLALLLFGINAYSSHAQLFPDSLENRIPDFSYAGYMAGEEAIPNLPVNIVVPNISGDATMLIQKALDKAGNLPAGANGFKAVVLLQAGEYRVSGSLLLKHEGVVLRGSGCGENGTRLIATGKDRRTLLRIAGKGGRTTGAPITITDDYTPVNAFSLTLSPGHNLKTGDKILIRRPSTKEWIEALGTAHFGGGITALGWKPGSRDIYWDREVKNVSGNRITIDAPLTMALDKKYGGGEVIACTWNGRIARTGIENLSCISEYDAGNPKDEAHAWMAITMENVSDAWVRNVNFRHFAGSAVYILETAKRITVENCKYMQPVSEIGGQRRYSFFTMGQQCLFRNLYSEYGYHDFAVGFCASGPNAFVQCYAYLPYSFSGPVDSWASGVLYDMVNIDGNALSYKNLWQESQGTGWNAANSVFWQCTASRMDCFAPPTAQNWAFGSWSEFSGNGYWEDSNNHIQPRSLYYYQMKKRLGEKYIDRAYLLAVETNATSSPTIEQADELTKAAEIPATPLSEWIDQVIAGHPIPVEYRDADLWKETAPMNTAKKIVPLEIKKGILMYNGKIAAGFKHNVTWWNGTVQPAYLETTAKPHLTRFVPGRTGTGLTDDLDSVVQWMKRENVIAIDHNYGLWYDRRRDDHERIRRIDGNVWPPFYEQPFARSGEGTASDGLSKYDLTKYNEWYWSRLKQFADRTDEEGLILLHENYFQHNIIEAGAHWADSPWRPANNINDTGFPEPVPYAGDKRIFMAEQFYDVTHPIRRKLHRAFIRQCLDNFKDNSSVIHLISEEYTGPLHFVRFWLDVISEWENETGKRPLIALSATKDVQDAILADPVRSKVIDIIDIRYWFYRADGSLYAPEGGKNLAPRQHARLVKPGKASAESVYRAVKEYRDRFPEKAVTYFSEGYIQYAQAVYDAGGSLPALLNMDNKY
ncbi:MAG: glycoside hydrolase family 55 protein [Dysgonamonadaceae bacterium]|jgi:hypothetical protein|nr:glycoside hydrolase family 55 protein [Dysgonamonadaceae bacterium]